MATSQNFPLPPRHPEYLSALAGFFAMGVGLLVLLGWGLHLQNLTSLRPSWVSMKANTALAFVFSGAALIFSGPVRPRPRWSKGLAAGAAFLGLAALLAYLFHWGPGLDEFLFRDYWATSDQAYPGRMAPVTAISFVLFGMGIWFLNSTNPSPPYLPQTLFLTIMLLSGLALIGYLYGVKALYQVSAFTTLAFHTAVTFVALALAGLFLRPREGLAGVIFSRRAGGRTARLLLPIAIFLPITMGWGRILVARVNWLSSDLLTAILVIVVFVVLGSAIVFQAAYLNRESEAREEKSLLLNAVLEGISEGIVVADTNGKMIYFNTAAERIIGLGMSKQDSSKWTEEYGVFHEDQVTPMAEEELPLTNALKGVEIKDQIQFLRNSVHPQGVFISVSGRRLVDEQGNLIGGLVVVRDITALRKLEEKRREYTQALESSNKEMQDFVFVASHDLQEPLRKIQSFGEFLRDEFKEALGETGRDYVERMQSAAGRMQTLINDLLALTRVTTKAKPFGPVDLSVVLQEVLSDLESNIQEKQARVEVPPLPTLEGDATQLRQLFQNLIGNALKYRKPDVSPRVKVSAAPLNGHGPGSGYWRIQIEDNGIGFDNQYSDQIFKVFERLHGRDEYEGTGIGLAICRKVVERHGGTISAEGRPGQGSVFTVDLPLRQKS